MDVEKLLINLVRLVAHRDVVAGQAVIIIIIIRHASGPSSGTCIPWGDNTPLALVNVSLGICDAHAYSDIFPCRNAKQLLDF